MDLTIIAPSVKVGIVMFYKYDPTNRKNFGFVNVNGGDSVYFNHKCRVEPFFDGGDNPQFGGLSHERIPKPGQVIEMDGIKTGERGRYAVRWWFKDEMDKVKAQITDRPTYRMWRQDGPEWVGRLCPHGYVEPRKQWEGKNLKLLRQMYPSASIPAVNKENWRLWFEVWSEDHKEWLDCDDPR